jgi:hypothetical protein
MGMEWESGDVLARIPCRSGALGDVLVRLDSDVGVIVEIEGMAHGHFEDFENLGTADVAERCVMFLDDLFNDRVVVWNKGASGGWFYTESVSEEERRETLRDALAGTWSKRVSA